MNEFQLTIEQQAIISAGLESKLSIMVNALAGCAKSTTIEALASAMASAKRSFSEGNLTQGAAAIAFNVKTKTELARRLPPTFDVLTLNGLGHRAWGRNLGRGLKLEEKKIGNLLKEVLKEQGLLPSQDEWSNMSSLISAAMAAGLVPQRYAERKPGLLPDEDASWEAIAEPKWLDATGAIIDICREVLTRSIALAYQGTICFDDQIYCSALLGGKFPSYPLVFIDEAQDLSPVNHLQLAACASGRIIAVGDPKQAIYSFRGADSASMAKIKGLRPEWIELPLNTTFRCPKTIVSRVRAHAVGFSAHSANKQGTIVNFIDKEDPSWSWSTIEALGARIEGHRQPTVAVLCRNNAPLLALAFKLLRCGTAPQMLGRDIGKGLLALLSKIQKDTSASAEATASAIHEWRGREKALAAANDKESKIAGIEDRAESLLAVLEGAGCATAGELHVALENLFSNDTGRVILSTGHRAKGLEYDLVIHLDPWRIPSKFAKKAAAQGFMAQLEQEENLSYVIDTRTKDTLVLANLEDFV